MFFVIGTSISIGFHPRGFCVGVCGFHPRGFCVGVCGGVVLRANYVFETSS
jgi:hypothetical protein